LLSAHVKADSPAFFCTSNSSLDYQKNNAFQILAISAILAIGDFGNRQFWQ